MDAVHSQVLDAACRLADRDWTFSVADLAGSLPHLNPGTVRTHVASRCCVNAPSHHASRHPYFRAIHRGRYRIEPLFRRRHARARVAAWQDRLLAAVPRGVDPTLIAESLKLSPTQRLETMRRAAQSMDAMTRR